MERNFSYRKHKEEVKIKKRLGIVRSWGLEEVVGDKSRYEKEPHRLGKYNLNCGCRMCKFYKHIGNHSGRKKSTDKTLYGE